jgi:hypothetical protein
MEACKEIAVTETRKFAGLLSSVLQLTIQVGFLFGSFQVLYHKIEFSVQLVLNEFVFDNCLFVKLSFFK